MCDCAARTAQGLNVHEQMAVVQLDRPQSSGGLGREADPQLVEHLDGSVMDSAVDSAVDSAGVGVPSRLGGRERGNASLFFVILMSGVLVMTGLVTDGASKMRAGRLAATTASEAARAASQKLTADAIVGQAASVDTAGGAVAARTYLREAGVNGSVRIAGQKVLVTTSVPWSPTFFGFVGGSTLTGTATATPKRT